MAESAKQALLLLRDPVNYQWSVIPLLFIAVYIYAVEYEKGNWNQIFAGLALWGMDWFNEIWNALVFHFNQFAPAWGTLGKSSFPIFIGLNIEICIMFSFMGIVYCKFLPADKNMKIMGMPNRLFMAIAISVSCVLIEYVLNAWGVLTWENWWWNTSAPWLIFLFGYLTFFLVCFWVHDMETVKKKAITVGSIFGFNALCIVIFGVILKWI